MSPDTSTQTGSHESTFGENAVPQPHLFVVLQCNKLGAPGLRICLKGLKAVRLGRGEHRGHELQPDGVLALKLADERISSEHCELRYEDRRYTLRDCGSKNGTRVNGQPITGATTLEDNALIEVGRCFLLFRRGCLAEPSSPQVFESAAEPGTSGLTTLIPQLAATFADLRAFARSALPVLVRGESGTGKELIANALHGLSKRPGPFVPVNCGAIPSALIASELFGYRKGAFSGALEDRPGLIRAAERGTLFLDEIGELHRDAQAALLRALQEGEVLPLGATRAVKVDVRVVAATHRDLEAMVATGEFRGDLLARLSGFTLRLPPLRARREDLGVVLSAILARQLPDRAELSLRTATARRLFAAAFPRNIRELERAVVAAATLSPSPVLELGEELGEADPGGQQALDAGSDADLEARLKALLKKHSGNVSAVAAELKKARMQIHRWMKRFSLDPADFRVPPEP